MRMQAVAGGSPRSSSSDKDGEEGGTLGRLTPAQRHQLAVLLDTAMLKVRSAVAAPTGHAACRLTSGHMPELMGMFYATTCAGCVLRIDKQHMWSCLPSTLTC